MIATILSPSLLTVAARRFFFPRGSYLKYIRPLYSTLATVNWRPSRPADAPSGEISNLPAPDLIGRSSLLVAFRNASRSRFLTVVGGDVLLAVFRRVGASLMPAASASLESVSVTLLPSFSKRRRGL